MSALSLSKFNMCVSVLAFIIFFHDVLSRWMSGQEFQGYLLAAIWALSASIKDSTIIALQDGK
jgi:hypothetical protein